MKLNNEEMELLKAFTHFVFPSISDKTIEETVNKIDEKEILSQHRDIITEINNILKNTEKEKDTKVTVAKDNTVSTLKPDTVKITATPLQTIRAVKVYITDMADRVNEYTAVLDKDIHNVKEYCEDLIDSLDYNDYILLETKVNSLVNKVEHIILPTKNIKRISVIEA